MRRTETPYGASYLKRLSKYEAAPSPLPYFVLFTFLSLVGTEVCAAHGITLVPSLDAGFPQAESPEMIAGRPERFRHTETPDLIDVSPDKFRNGNPHEELDVPGPGSKRWRPFGTRRPF